MTKPKPKKPVTPPSVANIPPVTPPIVVTPPVETVNVPKDKFDEIMKRMDILEKVASKARMEKFATHPNVGTSCRISTYEDDDGVHVVTSWKLIKDIAIKDSKNERMQIMELTLENDKKIEIEIEQFYNILQKEEIDIDTDKSKYNKDGMLEIVSFTRNGVDYNIPVAFVN